jgi:outer membrane protein assembly factor BamB
MASRECKFYLISWDGPILWSYSIGAWSDSDSMDGAIIDDIDDDTVFDTVVGGRDSKITALSGVNGRVIWDYAISGWVGSVINAGDLNGDAYDDVVVGSWDTNVYAINGYNGSLLWKFVTPVDGDAPASVAILGDINSDGTLDVAVGLDDVYALDGKTGYQIWKSTDSFLGIETIVTTDLNTDGILDVCIGTCGVDPYANVYAVNGHNGNTLWSFLEPESTIYGLTAGDIDNDRKNDIIAGSQDTDVYALTTEIISGTVGAISVSSSPSGATMHLAGFAGPSIKTPYTITNVPVGMSTITLSLDGYLDWSTNVEVRAGETTSVHAALTPISTQTEMKPDLVIYSITGIGVVGEPLTIYYTITNQGNAVAQQSYSGLYIDGKYIKKDYVDTLAPGATINQKSFDYIWDCTVGDQATIQVCADVGHQVAESNEMNNCKSDFWTCPS